MVAALTERLNHSLLAGCGALTLPSRVFLAPAMTFTSETSKALQAKRDEARRRNLEVARREIECRVLSRPPITELRAYCIRCGKRYALSRGNLKDNTCSPFCKKEIAIARAEIDLYAPPYACTVCHRDHDRRENPDCCGRVRCAMQRWKDGQAKGRAARAENLARSKESREAMRGLPRTANLNVLALEQHIRREMIKKEKVRKNFAKACRQGNKVYAERCRLDRIARDKLRREEAKQAAKKLKEAKKKAREEYKAKLEDWIKRKGEYNEHRSAQVQGGKIQVTIGKRTE